MKNRLGRVAHAYVFQMADMKVKKDSVCRWKWEGTKTEKLLDVFISYKRQTLGEGVDSEWDSYKVVLLSF